MLLVLTGPAGPHKGRASSPRGADIVSTSSRAHGHGEAAAVGARATLGQWHQGLTFVLEVPVLSIPTPCSKDTWGTRAPQPGTA